MSRRIRTLSTFRLHLLGLCVTSTLCFVGVIATSLFVPLAMQLDRPELAPEIAGGIAEHFLYVHSAFWPVVVCSLGSTVLSALVLYRKLTRPFVRFVRSFDEVARGESLPAPITLRRTDYLTAEVDALNRMVDALRDRAAKRETALAELDALQEALEAQGQAALAARVRDAHDALA